MFLFHTPGKHKKIFVFQMISGRIKWEDWLHDLILLQSPSHCTFLANFKLMGGETFTPSYHSTVQKTVHQK